MERLNSRHERKNTAVLYKELLKTQNTEITDYNNDYLIINMIIISHQKAKEKILSFPKI